MNDCKKIMGRRSLSEWEEKARNGIQKGYPPFRVIESCEIVLTLIDLVRKKDEYLKAIETPDHIYTEGCDCKDIAKEALELTQKLGEKE